MDWRVQITLRVGGGVKKQVLSLGQNQPVLPVLTLSTPSGCPGRAPLWGPGDSHLAAEVQVCVSHQKVSSTRRVSVSFPLAFQGPEWSPAQSKCPMTVCGVNSGKYERTL